MKKTTAIWLIVASALMLSGFIMFAALVGLNAGDFSSFSTSKYETNTYEVNERFTSLRIAADTEDISFLKSTDGKCRVVCFEDENLKHSVKVENGELKIGTVDERKWYNYIMNFHSAKISVFLPEAAYSNLSVNISTGDVDIAKDFTFESIDVSLSTGNVKCSASVTGIAKINASTGDVNVNDASLGMLEITTSTGDISVARVTCGDLSLNVSTGKIELSGISCQNLTSTGSTGDIEMRSVIASGTFKIKRSTGDVDFEASDAGEINILTDTGDVKGSLLSEKIFIIDTDTGKKDVPKTLTGGKCEITTDTGDIKIRIK